MAAVVGVGREQWIASPSKSVVPMSDPAPKPSSKAVLKDQLPNWASAEFAPNTVWRSDVSFSSSISAEPMPAKSQPARVKPAHGAGVFTPAGLVAVAGWGMSVSSGFVGTGRVGPVLKQ